MTIDTESRALPRQQSPWLPSDHSTERQILALLTAEGSHDITILRRSVHDGELTAIRRCDPPSYLWHMSVSHEKRNRRRTARYPTWDELIDARCELLPENIDVVVSLPSWDEWTDTTFHLYQTPPSRERESEKGDS